MKRFLWLMAVLAAVTALVAVLWFGGNPFRAKLPPVRALWVTRFDYSAPEDVQRIVANVAEAGFTDVFFQIRGNGTVYYPSRLEPWAQELSGGTVGSLGKDPGWDPLQAAIDEARPSGLRVHAYMNVLPGWKGIEEPPVAAGQLWTEHPDWFMVDSLGAKMLPTTGWYSFLNPVLPAVREHLDGIVRELCAYDVAGIHLDYIRYPHDYDVVARQRYPEASKEEILRRSDFSYDPVSLAVLREKYGDDVTREEVVDFRCESVTRVVRDIAHAMQVERPGHCLLSASVKGNPVEGKYRAYQDSGAWVRQGLVDWAVQMNYGTRSFDRHLDAMKKTAGKRGFRSSVVVGLYCKNDVETLAEQIETANRSGCRGLALFSYGFLFDEQHRPTEKGRRILEKLRPEIP